MPVSSSKLKHNKTEIEGYGNSLSHDLLLCIGSVDASESLSAQMVALPTGFRHKSRYCHVHRAKSTFPVHLCPLLRDFADFFSFLSIFIFLPVPGVHMFNVFTQKCFSLPGRGTSWNLAANTWKFSLHILCKLSLSFLYSYFMLERFFVSGLFWYSRRSILWLWHLTLGHLSMVRI